MPREWTRPGAEYRVFWQRAEGRHVSIFAWMRVKYVQEGAQLTGDRGAHGERQWPRMGLEAGFCRIPFTCGC